MKAIMVMFDSLNRRMLSPYGCDWTHTPNFARLARRCATFDNSYVGSMPCMPARRELHTGRLNFLHRGWSPLEPFDDSMPERLKKNGVYSHMVTDHLHYFEEGGATYHQKYSSWEFIRGQQGDPCFGVVEPEGIPKDYTSFLYQDAVNRQIIDSEDKQPQTRVFDAGLDFIRRNMAADSWFLQIETFDPHEPFYSMEEYHGMYPPHRQGLPLDWPPYHPVPSDDDTLQDVIFNYAALLSMCDRNLGRILDIMDANDMWKDTLLIVNTDHGYTLGEHGWWAKSVFPWYNETAHTPLFIWHPEHPAAGQRRQALVQTIDLAPTVLEAFGVSLPDDMQGKPLSGVLDDDRPVRKACMFGSFGGQVNVTDGRYVYMRGPKDKENKPLYEYTLMPTHMFCFFTPDELRTMEKAPPFGFTKGCPLMRFESRGLSPVPDISDQRVRAIYPGLTQSQLEKFFEKRGTFLFDLESDPGQLHPLSDDSAEAEMISLMLELMEENEAPAEQYERLGLTRVNP